jgi:hypothetical protein
MDYLKNHLNDCKNDSACAKSITGSYDLNACSEKWRFLNVDVIICDL